MTKYRMFLLITFFLGGIAIFAFLQNFKSSRIDNSSSQINLENTENKNSTETKIDSDKKIACINFNSQNIEDYCNEAIKAEPNDATLYYSRGRLFLYSGKLQAAIDDFDAAIKIKKDYADAYYRKGLAFFILGNEAEAIKNYKQSATLDKNYYQLFENRNLLWFEEFKNAQN